MEISLPFIEFESQTLVITVTSVYKGTLSPQSSLSDLLQNRNPPTELKNSLHGSFTSLTDEMQTQDASCNIPSTNRKDFSETPKKCEPHSSKSPQKKNNILNDSAFLPSNILPPTLKPSQKL